MESGWDEHSARDPRPDSIPDPGRLNPADGVAVAMVQAAVMGEVTPPGLLLL